MAEGPQPPLEDRTNGVKVPCSTCRILCSYALLFSLSCLQYVELVEDELLVGAKELNTLTSKKALLWLLSQTFWALMSSLAPSSVLVLRRGKLSPVRGWRVGSRPRFGHTQEISSDVPDSVMADRWQGSIRATEGMINSE